MKFKPFYVFQALIVLAVIVVVVTGFFIIGSPSQERAKRLDDQRSNDLQSISSAIDQYYNLNGRDVLPQSLDELHSTPNVYISSINDPRTGQLYDFRTVSSTAYELCANFETDTAGQSPLSGVPVAPRPYASPVNQPPMWSHGIGQSCFTLNVNIWPNPQKLP